MKLTVPSNGSTLEELEPIISFESRNLALREFCQELGLLIVNHVFIRRYVNRHAAPGSNCSDLTGMLVGTTKI